MTIWEAIAADIDLTIRGPGEAAGRIMAYTFKTPDGLVFLDVHHEAAIGWNPVHDVPGKLSGSGPWKIGDFTIRPIEHGDPECHELNAWKAFLDTKRGRRYGRTNARAILERNGHLPA